MQTIFFDGKLNRYTTEKLLSTKNGRIEIYKIEDAMVYGQTQGLYFYWHYKNKKLTDYALSLAQLMIEERRNKIATKCYKYALYYAFIAEYNNMLYGNGDRREVPDPDEIYDIARTHLLKMGNSRGLENLKNYYKKYKRNIALEEEYFYLSRRRNKIDRVEKLIEKSIPIKLDYPDNMITEDLQIDYDQIYEGKLLNLYRYSSLEIYENRVSFFSAY